MQTETLDLERLEMDMLRNCIAETHEIPLLTVGERCHFHRKVTTMEKHGHMLRSSYLVLVARVMSRGLLLALSIVLSGCAMTPSINVLGAFFPDWIFCAVVAIALTLLTRHILFATGWDDIFTPMSLSASSLAFCTLFALFGWLIFFQN